MTRRDRDRDRDPKGTPRDPSRRGEPLLAGRAAYFALVNQGIGSREAGRRVGISYRTAKYWQAASKAAAATAAPPRPVTISTRYRSLHESLHERILIADRVGQPGVSPRAVAVELGPSVSTITRERAAASNPTAPTSPIKPTR
jgi:transposase